MEAQPTWADKPYALLSTMALSKSANAHPAQKGALAMAYTHNALLRALNAILQQGPYILDSTSSGKYIQQDVLDLLFFTEAWAKAMEHHHNIEETVFFPSLQKIDGVPPHFLDGSTQQHTLIHEGLVRLLDYVGEASRQPREYRWETLKSIIDSFSSELLQHLKDEVDVLMSLEAYCEPVALQACLNATEKAALADVSVDFLSDLFPIVLGSNDKTYEDGSTWPELPFFMPYMIDWWFSRRRRGAWRFCPCDVYGRPRPLQMLPAKES